MQTGVTVLASGEISHLLSGENDQSQSDRNNQATILWMGVSCIYIRDVHARLAQRANRLSARPYGWVQSLFPSLYSMVSRFLMSML